MKKIMLGFVGLVGLFSSATPFAQPYAIINCNATSLTVIHSDIPLLDIGTTTSCAEVLRVLDDANYVISSTIPVGTSIIYTLRFTPQTLFPRV